MRCRASLSVCAFVAVLVAGAGTALAAGAAERAADEIAPGVHLVPGKLVPGQQPDGNSVIFRAPEGAVVVDTGRHVEHTEAVLARLAALGLEPRVIVNSHWHLDHVGGNVLFRDRYPDVRVFASGALADAQRGFLADYRKQLEQMVASADTGAAAKESYRREMGLIDAGPRLAPTDVVTKSGRQVLAGRPLELHLEEHAVTAGDVWVFDPATKVLVAGDLVTLPAPFLDTACPARWQAALGRLEKDRSWELLVPGHGAPMHHKELALYRQAFDQLLACAASTAPAAACVDGWFRTGGELVSASDPGVGHDFVGYYVNAVLRGDPAKTKQLCGG